ncbi:MAG: CoA-binding protein [Chloroflexota bacterium]|nr:CoA-binding protein [Chloroflexota bacterium]
MSDTEHELEYLFHPKSIAVVGVSSNPSNHIGRILLEPLLTSRFEGKVHPVGAKGGKFKGLKIYPRLSDIPEDIDYVIVSIPAPSIPQLMKECIRKRVKTVSFFTAGFEELGMEEGKRLEGEIVRIARQGGIRLLGPNCVGIYCPKTGLAFTPDSPRESGSVGFICQSGGNSVYMLRGSVSRGIRFSKIVSIGNASDLNESDILDYLARDPETEIIAIYIEGLKDGKRFRRVLEEASAKKPVIVLKGGSSESGTRAAASHTANLAGSDLVWDHLLRQTGVIRVYSIEEMIDLIVTLTHTPVVTGKNVGIMGWGGAASIQAADDFERSGFILPHLSAEVKSRLRQLIPVAGSILANPVDSALWLENLAKLSDSIKVFGAWYEIDFMVLHMGISSTLFSPSEALNMLPPTMNAYRNGARAVEKPVIIVLHSGTSPEIWEAFSREEELCRQSGFAVYTSFERAANATMKVIRHHQQIKEVK